MVPSHTAIGTIWADGAGREEHLPPACKSEELELGARLPTGMCFLGARSVLSPRGARGWKPEASPGESGRPQPGVPFPGDTGDPGASWPLGRSPDSGSIRRHPAGSRAAPRGGPDAAPAPWVREAAGGEWPSPWRPAASVLRARGPRILPGRAGAGRPESALEPWRRRGPAAAAPRPAPRAPGVTGPRTCCPVSGGGKSPRFQTPLPSCIVLTGLWHFPLKRKQVIVCNQHS